MEAHLVQSFFLIFTGAAILASLALFSKQPLLVAYIVLGALLGPTGLGYVTDLQLLDGMSHVGIIFLLFLLGLDMQPKSLINVLKQVTWVTLLSSLLFFAVGFAVGSLWGFTFAESMIVGAAMMFSSTIIGIKLLPTTALHHKHSGEMMVGLLLMQDFLAIFVLIILFSGTSGNFELQTLGLTVLALPLVIGLALAVVKWILLPLFARFDRMGEYIFLLAIGWCLGMAELAAALGLSTEVGAFIAGITIATSPIAQYIALSLKPLRDFFLILFFFSLGAGFDLTLLDDVLIPALILAGLCLALKPVIYHFLLRRQSESDKLAWDVGFRLGQISEFSLLIAFVAFGNGLIGVLASHAIQAAAILTFVISSYIVVFNFPSPIAPNERLRRD